MGVLADLYIASDDQEAVKYDASPDAFGDRRQYRNFTALELSTLWAIMQGTEWDVVLMDQFPELLGVEDGERLVHRLPSHMVETLAQMTQEGVLASSGKWAATDGHRAREKPSLLRVDTDRLPFLEFQNEALSIGTSSSEYSVFSLLSRFPTADR
jgi:hypothetical protein